MKTTIPAERRGALRADKWEGTMDQVITREKHRKTAIIVGVLFIIGDIAGVLSYVVTGGLLDGPDALTKIAASQNQVVLGALLVLVMGLALAMVPILMFPVFKKYNEVLALGCVVFRGALETVAYMASAGTWLLLVELSRQHAAAASPGAPHFQTLSALLAGPIPGYLTAIVFSLGSLMFYYLFYQSRLIPRWLSVWGLAGAVLYLAWPLLALFDHGFGLLMLPLAVAEIVLAVWLIAKGLNFSALKAAPA
ncbi:MAG: DUF4386 domain-containing protein [Actinobacteria bacterium]|nr:DUF4386 domain-containing protein [Actinomycetota bacterium]